MKKLTTLLTICALCTGSLLAQNLAPLSPRKFKTTTPEEIFAPQRYKLATKPGTPRQLADVPESTVIWEDFAKFTEGSEATPGTVDVGQENGVIPESLTQMPGWTGAGVFQAGGMAYLSFFEGQYGQTTGVLNTPQIDLSGNGGAFIVKFRAKSTAAEGDQVSILNLNAQQFIGISSVIIPITNEWADYVVPMDQGIKQSAIQIWAETNEWYIDDFQVLAEGTYAPNNIHVTSFKGTEATIEWDPIEGATYAYNLIYADPITGMIVEAEKNVEISQNFVTVTELDPTLGYGLEVASKKDGIQSPFSRSVDLMPCVEGPEPIAPTDYDGTSFTASWKPMENATKYTLYVAHGEFDGWSETMVIDQELETTETSHKVTGLDPETIYSFAVQAVLKDGEITKTSLLMKVAPEIEAPVAKEATEVTANSFVANWSESKEATHYQVTAYKEHTALTAGEYAIADADFSYIESNGTLEMPETLWQQFVTPAESGAFDWYISMGAIMNGAVGLDNAYASMLGPGFMYSPLYDLTPFGNKASFDITLASADATGAIIALAYVDEDNYLQEIESFEVPASAEWTTQHVEFTKGGEEVCVLVYAVDGTYMMFKDFKLTIDMPKDSKIELPYNRALTEGELSYKFENIAVEDGDRIGYDVLAAKITETDQFVSNPSNRIWVNLSGSVEGLKMQEVPVVYMNGNVLNVENPAGAAVEVYNMAGVKVFSDNSGEAVVRTQLDMRGAYIVKVGNTAVKVMR